MELKYWIFVFNTFKADYNDELNVAFAQMKADGINDWF